MPSSASAPSPASRDAVVAALRAAGCVFAEDEARLISASARTAAEREAMVRRRVAGHPLEQVVGWAEFCGLRIAVDPGVFVPRRRTEFLAERAAALAPARAVVLDLCCGTGAIGAAVAALASVAVAELHATDLDPAAVRCARRNLAPFAGHVHEGDLYVALPPALRGRVDVLLANVPYVPTHDIPLLPAEAREHEPRLALDGGPDGLAVLRRAAARAPDWLAPGGSLLTETSDHQAAGALRVLGQAGLTPRLATSPRRGAIVVIAGRRR